MSDVPIKVGDIRIDSSTNEPYLVSDGLNFDREFILIWLREIRFGKPLGISVSQYIPNPKDKYICNINQIFMNIADMVFESGRVEDELGSS